MREEKSGKLEEQRVQIVFLRTSQFSRDLDIFFLTVIGDALIRFERGFVNPDSLIGMC
ncbi:hypothetical protein N665_1030s0023 [Sinapis alba]|nr:hypothetical protein N665_1030s0023 [Sinapis alba]